MNHIKVSSQHWDVHSKQLKLKCISTLMVTHYAPQLILSYADSICYFLMVF